MLDDRSQRLIAGVLPASFEGVKRTNISAPDSDKVGLWTGDPDLDILVRRDSGVDYYDGE